MIVGRHISSKRYSVCNGVHALNKPDKKLAVVVQKDGVFTPIAI